MTDRRRETTRHARPQLGLWLKLTAASLLVAILGVSLVALLANRVTVSELRYYMVRGQLTDAEELQAELADYYATYGNWDGVAGVLAAWHGSGRGSGRGGGQLYLANAEGRVGAGAASDELGRELDQATLAHGLPIEVNGGVVGTLIVSNAWTGALGQVEEQVLDQVNRALIWGGLGAVLVALLLGTVLAWRITTPVRRLTQAAEDIAAGNLGSRAQVHSEDEIGQLADSFNRMADNLARSDELRRRMTADIAHELRTPLSVIRGQIEAIQDGIFPPDATHLAPIHEEILLLNRLIEDLRTLTLADAGQLTLQKAAVNPGALVRRTVAKFGPLAAERDIILTVELAPQLPSVVIDTHRIEQVLTNLLANALRHTPPQGVVTLRAEADQRRLLIAVADTGPGIPPEDIPRLFDRFWRGDKSRARDRGGAGLGLAIARQLVEAHGGTIWAESQPESGTTFHFALPLA
jgi:two-component system sensor histidine kinase BaeS